MKPKEKAGRTGLISLRLLIAGAICIGVPLLLLAGSEPPGPSWWYNPSLTTTGKPVVSGSANDYAAINQGQLKNIASAAAAEFDSLGYSGSYDGMVAKWKTPTSKTNDYSAANIGEVKAVAQPFYDKLAELHYTGPPLTWAQWGQKYPWDGFQGTINDYAIANIGQVKNVFSFVVPVFALSISPSVVAVPLNGQASLSVSVSDQFGDSMNISNVAWTVNGGGNIDGQGNQNAMFTSNGKTGAYTVTATSGTMSATASVTVYGPVLSGLSLSEDATAIAPDGWDSFWVSGTDQNGNPMNVSNTSWSVSGGGSLTGYGSSAYFNSNGTLGNYTVTAKVGTMTATAP